MIVLAARPSLGKSALAFNIARHAAGIGSIIGIFSLEMGRENIGMRLLASEANVNSTRLRMGLLRESEERSLLDAIGLLSDLPLYIDDTPIQGIVEMRGKARRLQAERGLDLLIVDYLQLISGGGRTENRAQEMGEISRSLKGLARDLDVPILACSSSAAPSSRGPPIVRCSLTSERAAASSRMPTWSPSSTARTSTSPGMNGSGAIPPASIPRTWRR